MVNVHPKGMLNVRPKGTVNVRPKESCWGLCSYSDIRVSVNEDDFMSPSPSNAMHQSPGFQ
jgi:hypothetical protein